MTTIRVIFDGKAFIPQEPVSLPRESEALVLVEGADSAEAEKIARATEEYYQSGHDADDEAWGQATSVESRRAWDED